LLELLFVLFAISKGGSYALLTFTAGLVLRGSHVNVC
jgi:hypothetical protein